MSCLFYYVIASVDGKEANGTLLLGEEVTVDQALSSSYVDGELRSAVGGDYKVLMFSMPECQGCRENQPNQQAHMDYGGCLADDE